VCRKSSLIFPEVAASLLDGSRRNTLIKTQKRIRNDPQTRGCRRVAVVSTMQPFGASPSKAPGAHCEGEEEQYTQSYVQQPREDEERGGEGKGGGGGVSCGLSPAVVEDPDGDWIPDNNDGHVPRAARSPRVGGKRTHAQVVQLQHPQHAPAAAPHGRGASRRSSRFARGRG
jgi:hypothetical protein